MNLSSSEPTIKSSAGPLAGGLTSTRAVAAGTGAVAIPRRRNRITMEGALFIALMLAIGLIALSNGNNLLYLVFWVMVSMLLVSLKLTRDNLTRLSLQRRYPMEFHAGEDAHGYLELRNDKRFFNSYAVRLRDLAIRQTTEKTAEPIQILGFAAMVRSRQSIKCPVTLRLNRRGLYRMAALQIVSRYPFGFFQRALRVDEGAQLLVYPRLMPAPALTKNLALTMGEIETDRKGLGLGLFGIRDYYPGDPARMIHWKHSAKGQGLKLKEFEEERTQSYRLMIDLRCGENPTSPLLENLEKAISLAASLARYLLQHQASVGLWTTQGRVPLAAGRRQFQRIMRSLARVNPQPVETDPPPLESDVANLISFYIQYQDEAGAEVDREPLNLPYATRVIDARHVEFNETEAESEKNPHGN